MPYTLEIVRDPFPANPREEFDHVFTLHFTNNRYISGDETINPDRPLDPSGLIVFPVFAYIHSGVALSVAPFSCPWDSGQIGYATVSKADFLREFFGNSARLLTKARRARALEVLKIELEEFQAYIDGDVFGYVIKDADDNEIFSCWGYYGEQYAEEDGQAHLESLEAKEQAA